MKELKVGSYYNKETLLFTTHIYIYIYIYIFLFSPFIMVTGIIKFLNLADTWLSGQVPKRPF